MPKEEILAVHQKKLEEFLKNLDLWDPLVRGELKCASCGTTISFDNIGLIIPSGDKIAVCCSNAECIFKLREKRSDQDEE